MWTLLITRMQNPKMAQMAIWHFKAIFKGVLAVQNFKSPMGNSQYHSSIFLVSFARIHFRDLRLLDNSAKLGIRPWIFKMSQSDGLCILPGLLSGELNLINCPK